MLLNISVYIQSIFSVKVSLKLTFTTWARWNQPIGSASADEQVKYIHLASQASVFNESCRVYAPQYRQATIGAMGALSKVNGRKALTLAYGDVKRAFYHFLDR
jgi:hypothetical protein